MIISRKLAKEKGLKHYFTGKPCKHGHISERYTSNNICVDCQSVSNNKHWSKYAHRLLTTGRLYKTNNTDKVTARARQYREENKDKINEDSRKWYEQNFEKFKDKIYARNKVYRSQNKEAQTNRNRKWRKKNRDHVNANARTYMKNHRGYYNAKEAEYRAIKLLATPCWFEKNVIEKIYEQARHLTLTTGIQHEVDHILPLQGKEICGLHCLNNLQILTRSDNRKKNRKLI